MNRPDWPALGLQDDILCESSREDGRIVLWRRADRDDRFQYWDRIGTSARPEVTREHGLCTVPATSVRARQRAGGRGLFGAIANRLRGSSAEETWTLPGGEAVERCGSRRPDLVLIWPEDPASPIDESRVRSARSDLADIRPLGERLWLASRGAIHGAIPPGTPPPQEEAAISPVKSAEAALDEALRGGDRLREAVALTDLGIFSIGEGNPSRAITCLEQAVVMFRELGDQGREIDSLIFLGEAILATGQCERGRAVLEQALSMARASGDQFAEKTALERIGMATANLRDPARALALFDDALKLTRSLGDRQQEPRLLWCQAIVLADLNQRDQAIARAQEAVELLTRLGKPEASWYGAQLQRYRMDLTALGVAPGAGNLPSAWMPGGQGNEPPTGPGLLRMAVSASQAMLRYLGSGMKTTPPELRKRRLDTCMACPHHTGLRCRVCGCFTKVKSRLLHESCPIGKWPG